VHCTGSLDRLELRHQYDRLKLIVNNSRFLILPDWHLPNLGSRILSLCQKRLNTDWQKIFGHPVVLLETFVDPQRFHGTVYKAANWLYLGNTKGFRRTRTGTRLRLNRPNALHQTLTDRCPNPVMPSYSPTPYRTGGSKMMLNAQQMQSLPSFLPTFPILAEPKADGIDSPRFWPLSRASLCGMRGYRAIADWAKSLGKNARQRFGCRFAKDVTSSQVSLLSAMS